LTPRPDGGLRVTVQLPAVSRQAASPAGSAPPAYRRARPEPIEG
jgi:hypothetical protein